MKSFAPGELVILSFIKIPCAIDYLVQVLPHHRTLADWQNAVGKAKEHFRANCTHDNIDEMHPVYRQHKNASTLSLESSSGLVYMHTQLLSYTASHFAAILEWEATETTEKLAKSLANHPFRFKGTIYKRTHTVRTVNRVENNETDNGGSFLEMSTSNEAALTWMYPQHIDTPAKATQWLHEQCVCLLRELSCVPDDVFMYGIETMSRDDEVNRNVLSTLPSLTFTLSLCQACFRCEFKTTHGKLTDHHVRAMEWAIRERGNWRVEYTGWGHGYIKETALSGVFVNGIGAATALVAHMVAVASSPPAPTPAPAPVLAPAHVLAHAVGYDGGIGTCENNVYESSSDAEYENTRGGDLCSSGDDSNVDEEDMCERYGDFFEFDDSDDDVQETL